MEAIAIDNHEIIKTLIKCGAHMTGSARALGENLCAAAARGLVKRLQSYRLAGANLSQGIHQRLSNTTVISKSLFLSFILIRWFFWTNCSALRLSSWPQRGSGVSVEEFSRYLADRPLENDTLRICCAQWPSGNSLSVIREWNETSNEWYRKSVATEEWTHKWKRKLIKLL